jgi:hypothetical protein
LIDQRSQQRQDGGFMIIGDDADAATQVVGF